MSMEVTHDVVFIKYDILIVSVINMSFACEVNENMLNMYIIAYLYNHIYKNGKYIFQMCILL